MDDPGEDFIQSFDDDALEALVEAMYLAAYADGEFSEAEREHFAVSIDVLTRGRLGGVAFRDLLARVIDEHGKADRAVRMADIKRRLTSPDARRVALVLATDMAAADGVLHDAERELILSLAAALDIDGDEAAELLKDSPEG